MGNYNPKLPTKHTGTNKYIAFVVLRNRPPTSADYKQPETGTLYSLGTLWLVGANPSSGAEGDTYILTKIVANASTWYHLNP